MSKYARGKYAKAISDRSGMEFPYREMVREWNGSFVHVSEYEPKQPQLEPKPQSADGISLLNMLEQIEHEPSNNCIEFLIMVLKHIKQVQVL